MGRLTVGFLDVLGLDWSLWKQWMYFFFFWKLLLLYLLVREAGMSHALVGVWWFVPWSTSVFHDVTPSLSPPFARVALFRAAPVSSLPSIVCQGGTRQPSCMTAKFWPCNILQYILSTGGGSAAAPCWGSLCSFFVNTVCRGTFERQLR